MRSKAMFLGLLAVILMVGNASACGPFFDDAYLVRGSEQEFLSMPEGDFKYELEQISGKKSQPQIQEQVTWDKPKVEYDALRTKTADADINDLKEALKTSKIPGWQKVKVIEAYSERRSAITEYVKKYVPTNPWIWYGDQFRSEQKDAVKIKIASDLESPFMRLVPKEFILYSEGAIEYHNGAFSDAIKSWATLLNLPANERQYRSMWASFMIGKTYLALNKDKESIPYFEMVRKLAGEGYKDTLGLAQESYGWQALAEYETGQYAASIKHYLKAMDVVSMYRVCRTIADLDDADFEKVVKDETALRVLIGWTVSHSSYYFYSNDENSDYIEIAKRLTKIIEKNKLNIPADNADRIAWMLYNLGKFQEADRWLVASKERSALAQWIRAKLLIRDGKTDKAIDIMRGLKNSFAKDKEFNRFYGKISTDVERKINTEHSILLLHRNEYLMAFKILLQGAYWEDIAYVAEKVLTKEELESYLNNTSDAKFSKAQTLEDVESRYDPSKPKDEDPGIWLYYSTNLEKPTLKSALYYLLARRYARDKQWDKALRYMPSAFKIEWEVGKPNADGYTEYEQKNKIVNLKDMLSQLRVHIVTAENARLPARQRAESYFQAALITRQYGMEPIGTELDPDGFVFRGGFAYDDSLITRFAIMDKEVESDYGDWFKEYVYKTKIRREGIKKGRKFIDGSQDEEDRVIGSLPTPFKRFHYRYKAADLMWKCAQLLPNNDELKAQALCLGGTYLKNKDKQEANRYYKALVKTCSNTELGKMTDKTHWFPDIKPEMIKLAN